MCGIICSITWAQHTQHALSLVQSGRKVMWGARGSCYMCRRAGNGTFRRGILIPSGGTTLINHAYATISVGVPPRVHLIMSTVGERYRKSNARCVIIAVLSNEQRMQALAQCPYVRLGRYLIRHCSCSNTEKSLAAPTQSVN